jgi:hypothetical protein
MPMTLQEAAMPVFGCSYENIRGRIKRLLYQGCPIFKESGRWMVYPHHVEAWRRSRGGKYLAIDELRVMAKPLERKCGVYFLFDGDELVYIGQTTDFDTRIAMHSLRKTKAFDRVAFIPAEKIDVGQVEAGYIARYKPKYNVLIHAVPDTQISG